VFFMNLGLVMLCISQIHNVGRDKVIAALAVQLLV
jgi:hypothetical protein